MKRRVNFMQVIVAFVAALVVSLLLAPVTSANFQDTRRGVVVITFEEGVQQPPQVVIQPPVPSEPEATPQVPVQQPAPPAETTPEETLQPDTSAEVVTVPPSDPTISQETDE